MGRGRGNSSNAGFSLLEVVVALAILGVGLPALAYLYSVALEQDVQSAKENQAYYLANSLLTEISQRRFQESVAAPGNGTDSGEVSSYDRRGFDDIDDYSIFEDTWGALTPPRDETGAQLTQYAGFIQYVTVRNVTEPTTGAQTRTLATETDGSTDFKLITVNVSWLNGKRTVQAAKLFALSP